MHLTDVILILESQNIISTFFFREFQPIAFIPNNSSYY